MPILYCYRKLGKLPPTKHDALDSLAGLDAAAAGRAVSDVVALGRSLSSASGVDAPTPQDAASASSS